jgi:murein DD-endopeptidase MepM/ murein hydrolase activator NlpD
MTTGRILTWLTLAAAGVFCAGGCGRRESPPPPASVVMVEPESLRRMMFPTERQDWDTGEAFQPTASGRPESALYGSVRSEQSGQGLRPSFHEGLDIAPARRNGGGALDSIFAAADGRVAYVNRIAGNSNYGKYIVLVHAGTVGEIYTLYAHLSDIGAEIQAGRPVKAGAVLGVMGHSSSSPIPAERAHLHFELGLIANAHYDRWYRAQKLKPDHGIYNGGNLLGIDPQAVFQAQAEDPDFSFLAHLETIPPAFELLLAAPRLPDFFQRYPRLWNGPPFNGRALALAVSENGLPLRGANASDSDLAALGAKPWLVRKVAPAVLGRNGCRLVVCREGTWTLGASGERWLEILVYR